MTGYNEMVYPPTGTLDLSRPIQVLTQHSTVENQTCNLLITMMSVATAVDVAGVCAAYVITVSCIHTVSGQISPPFHCCIEIKQILLGTVDFL